jgi:hypothetical protein
MVRVTVTSSLTDSEPASASEAAAAFRVQVLFQVNSEFRVRPPRPRPAGRPQAAVHSTYGDRDHDS